MSLFRCPLQGMEALHGFLLRNPGVDLQPFLAGANDRLRTYFYEVSLWCTLLQATASTRWERWTKTAPGATPDVAECKATPVWQATWTVTTPSPVLQGLCCASCAVSDTRRTTLMTLLRVMCILVRSQELRQVAERQGDGSEEAYRTPQPPPGGKMAYATNANGEQPGVTNKPNSVDVLKCAHAVAQSAQH